MRLRLVKRLGCQLEACIRFLICLSVGAGLRALGREPRLPLETRGGVITGSLWRGNRWARTLTSQSTVNLLPLELLVLLDDRACAAGGWRLCFWNRRRRRYIALGIL